MSTEIIMFTSPTCSACKVMKPIVENMKNASIVDVTLRNDLARKYNIRGGLPVFVRLKNGEYEDRMSGYVSDKLLRRWAAK